jgi:hypothetical protein
MEGTVGEKEKKKKKKKRREGVLSQKYIDDPKLHLLHLLMQQIDFLLTHQSLFREMLLPFAGNAFHGEI